MPVEHVAVGGEVVVVGDQDRPARPGVQGGAGQLVEVHRGRVAHHDLARAPRPAGARRAGHRPGRAGPSSAPRTGSARCPTPGGSPRRRAARSRPAACPVSCRPGRSGRAPGARTGPGTRPEGRLRPARRPGNGPLEKRWSPAVPGGRGGSGAGGAAAPADDTDQDAGEDQAAQDRREPFEQRQAGHAEQVEGVLVLGPGAARRQQAVRGRAVRWRGARVPGPGPRARADGRRAWPAGARGRAAGGRGTRAGVPVLVASVLVGPVAVGLRPWCPCSWCPCWWLRWRRRACPWPPPPRSPRAW